MLASLFIVVSLSGLGTLFVVAILCYKDAIWCTFKKGFATLLV